MGLKHAHTMPDNDAVKTFAPHYLFSLKLSLTDTKKQQAQTEFKSD